jgi:hypothetical protein
MKALLIVFIINIFMKELSQNQNLRDGVLSDSISDTPTNDFMDSSVSMPPTIPDTTNTSNTSNTTIPPINSEVILLGFDNFKKENSSFFTFNTILKRIDTNYKITNIKFPIIIFYKNRLRFLEENKQDAVDCNCVDNNKENVECVCKGRSDADRNISSIALVEDFVIDDVKRNLTLSSLAKNQKYKIDKQKEDIFKPNDSIEIMKISELNDLSSNFTLKGNSTNIPTSSKFTLIASKYNYQKEFLCNKIDYLDGYALYCENPSKVINLDLNNTLAKTNESEKLIIQFPPDVQSKIGESLGGYYNSRKKKGLSTGGIIAIIIPCLIVLFGALALVFLLKRNPNPEPKSINNNTIGIASSTNINEKM